MLPQQGHKRTSADAAPHLQHTRLPHSATFSSQGSRSRAGLKCLKSKLVSSLVKLVSALVMHSVKARWCPQRSAWSSAWMPHGAHTTWTTPADAQKSPRVQKRMCVAPCTFSAIAQICRDLLCYKTARGGDEIMHMMQEEMQLSTQNTTGEHTALARLTQAFGTAKHCTQVCGCLHRHSLKAAEQRYPS